MSSKQILSRIDYCNSIYYKLPAYLLKKLQNLMNKSARLIYCKPSGEHVSPLYIKLHWQFKLCTLVHNALHQESPTYLKSKIKKFVYVRGPNTRNSCDPYRLEQPFVNSGYGARSFTHAAPRIFNKLPRELRNEVDLTKFKRRLKTYFFAQAYDLETKTTQVSYKL